MEEKQSWITEAYKEFWDQAEELSKQEIPNANITSRAERRDKHLDAMINMFMATMLAPEPDVDEDEEDDDCGGIESDECDNCDQLRDCRERWAREARKN
jgi:hypothetical protein